jgi:hypothetical protein
MWRETNAYKSVVEKLFGKIPNRRLWSRLKDNIKMNLKIVVISIGI